MSMNSFQLAAMGDGLIGPLVHLKRGSVGLNRAFVDQRFVNWLRILLPGIGLPERAVFGVPGLTTGAIAKRTYEILNLDPLPDAVLICRRPWSERGAQRPTAHAAVCASGKRPQDSRFAARSPPVPGENLTASGELNIRTIQLRKVSAETVMRTNKNVDATLGRSGV